MSGTRPPRSADNVIQPPKSTSGRPTPSDQHPIDRRLKRLRDEVLPLYPFLLTVPSDVPFRLGNRFVNNWAVSNEGPFAPEEQQLQYMTFLTHDEGDSLLVAVGDWSDGTGSVMAEPRSLPLSAASTPSSASIKKKISLNDYKNKRKSGASASPVSHDVAGQSGSTLHVPNENQHTSKPSPPADTHQNPPRKTHSPNPPTQSDTERIARKRRPESDHDSYSPQGKNGTLAKKRRLSTEPATTPPKAEPSNINGLPELLSPTLPPTSSPPRLPRLLSPTLPPDLERELAKLDSEPVASDSQPETTTNGNTAKPKFQKEKLSAAGTSRPEMVPAAGAQSVQTKSSGSRLDKSASQKANLQPQPVPRPPQPSSTKPVNHASSSRPHLIVKLKYGRSNRKRVEALLKFSGKKKPLRQTSPLDDLADQDSSHAAKPEQPRVSSDPLRKPARLDGKAKPAAGSQANQSSRDRSKEPRTAEKPRTPVPNQIQQERTRPASITPAKDLKNPSSRHDLATNDGKAGVRNTPGESVSVGTKQSPSQPGSAERNVDRRAWKEEYQKYGNLGRELKHAAERHTAKDKVTSSDEKLAAATAIEAILCFIVAFVADDQSKAASRQIGDSAAWLSIIAYWRVVKKNSFPYPPLYSLCLILGAVSYDAIHALDLERLAVTPLPGEHTPVPTPASDGHSGNTDESKRSLKDFIELRNRLPECYKESQRLWSEGSRGLSEDILASEFPNTWSKRARNYSEQGKKRLKPGDYSGEIYLPLGKASTPLEIIRFGCAILREWCSKENIDWRGRLDL